MTQPAGVQVVWLHGFLGCAEDFAEVRRALRPRLAGIAIDLPGHGRSPDPVLDTDFAGGVEQVRRMLRDRAIDRCALVGYSMGGRLALALAAADPDLVRAVVAIGAHPGLRSPAARDARRRADARHAAALRGGLDAFLDQWYAQPLFTSLANAAGFDAVRARRRGGDGEQLARALEVFGTGMQPDLRPGLHAARRPLLLIAGALDDKFSAIGRALASELPSARFAAIGDAGHAVPAEAPGPLAAMVDEFLSLHLAPPA